MIAVVGMCDRTGNLLSGVAHVRQSISRIVLTLIGTRVQRRDFGCNQMALISGPGNEATRVLTIAILAKALLKWEPRIKLSHIKFNINFDGRAIIEIHYSYAGSAQSQEVFMRGTA